MTVALYLLARIAAAALVVPMLTTVLGRSAGDRRG